MAIISIRIGLSAPPGGLFRVNMIQSAYALALSGTLLVALCCCSCGSFSQGIMHVVLNSLTFLFLISDECRALVVLLDLGLALLELGFGIISSCSSSFTQVTRGWAWVLLQAAAVALAQLAMAENHLLVLSDPVLSLLLVASLA